MLLGMAEVSQTGATPGRASKSRRGCILWGGGAVASGDHPLAYLSTGLLLMCMHACSYVARNM